MIEDTVAVHFLSPHDTSVQVPRGESLGRAAALANIVLDMPCGGRGNCGKCKIRVKQGVVVRSLREHVLLSHDELMDGIHLACQTRVGEPLTVEVPHVSLLTAVYQILADAAETTCDVSDPPVRARHVTLDPPSLEDDASDVLRLERVLGSVEVDLDVLRTLPAALRHHGFVGTALMQGGRLIGFTPGTVKQTRLAAAFDIGTTTLAASLINLEDGVERARAVRLNPQTAIGDDILTRIAYASESSAHLERLHRDVVGAVCTMLGELVHAANEHIEHIVEITFAGNTTMQHLLLGVDPASIGVSPFVPAVSEQLSVSASKLGLPAHPKAQCYVYPVISAYVGGDTVAGLLATNFEELESPSLFMDIGTNGELAVHAKGKLIATSCAAGPAFEGAGITHGLRAAAGAIEAVHIEQDVMFKTIDGAAALGICGSALIDVVAELLRLGILLPSGELLNAEDAPCTLPDAVRQHIRRHRDQTIFVIADAHDTATGQSIAVYQNDIRQVQLATAAVRSAVTLLLKEAGIEAHELRRVLVAGAFGNYIRCANAQRMGLLPIGVKPDRITFVGNTSLAGARLTATSLRARRLAQEIAQRTDHLDLSLDPAFQDIYVDALFFPTTNDASEVAQA
ncbi:MAG: DUF4445 domain-containing protein [Candidatus Hydrogenedentes bacterium]|nr:DUF4445 domain-containing protein [Candidatus Hydrogenedentota bacterium]